MIITYLINIDIKHEDHKAYCNDKINFVFLQFIVINLV